MADNSLGSAVSSLPLAKHSQTTIITDNISTTTASKVSPHNNSNIPNVESIEMQYESKLEAIVGELEEQRKIVLMLETKLKEQEKKQQTMESQLKNEMKLMKQ